MIYSSSRQVYVSFILNALKDNSVAKKGESYIKVKKDKFASVELFKDTDNLDKKYPRIFQISEPELISLLNTFKGVDVTAKEFTQFHFKL